MTSKFEVGKRYEAQLLSNTGATVLKRTAKMIYVENDFGLRFGMKIREDENGEFAYPSNCGAKWISDFTFRASMARKRKRV